MFPDTNRCTCKSRQSQLASLLQAANSLHNPPQTLPRLRRGVAAQPALRAPPGLPPDRLQRPHLLLLLAHDGMAPCHMLPGGQLCSSPCQGRCAAQSRAAAGSLNCTDQGGLQGAIPLRLLLLQAAKSTDSDHSFLVAVPGYVQLQVACTNLLRWCSTYYWVTCF